MKDVAAVLVAASFVNDEAPNSSTPPNTPIFRVGLSYLQPMQDGLGNIDKTVINARIQVTYIHPISGGNPQQTEYDIALAIEAILTALATTPNKLDAGTALSFVRCQIRRIRPSFSRADIYLDAALSTS